MLGLTLTARGQAAGARGHDGGFEAFSSQAAAQTVEVRVDPSGRLAWKQAEYAATVGDITDAGPSRQAKGNGHSIRSCTLDWRFVMTVLVAGGGIGGLATAIALRQRRVDVTVLERAGEIREVGAGITLWINAMRALRRLGVADAIAKLGAPALDGDIRTWQGKTLTHSLARELVEKYGELIVALHRADLQRVLLDAAGERVVRLGAECIAFEQDAAGVTVRLADGSVERGDALIGADGLWSTVRAQLFGQAKPRYAGYVAWRGVVPFSDQGAGFESWGRGQRFGLVPIGRGRVYWYATANVPEGSYDGNGHQHELLRRFGHWHEPIPEILRLTPESAILRNDLYDREPLRRWGEGRVTLLGDAAHPMTPNFGQGACQAIEDAVVLADCLVDSREIAGALRTYEARRVRRAAALVKQSRRFGQIGQLENPLSVWLRDRVIGNVPVRLQRKQLEAIIVPSLDQRDES